MIDLTNVSLLAMQSRYMREDITTQALCAALEPFVRTLGTDIRKTMVYPRIDELSGDVLDVIAWGYHVDAYNALAPDAEKRRMIKNSFAVHKYKGTVYAVQQIIEGVFGEAADVAEWFDYGGDPYHFRVDVLCRETGASEADQNRAVRLIETGKKLSAVLDGVRLILYSDASVVVGSAASVGTMLAVYPRD